MKTRTIHVTNFGKFAPMCPVDDEGYILVHDSERYSDASDRQLAAWRLNRFAAVRNAAAVEISERKRYGEMEERIRQDYADLIEAAERLAS